MLKAVLRQGVIVPLEPLPRGWDEGAALEVAKADAPPVDIDAWARSMDQLCADRSPSNEETMRRAIEAGKRIVSATYSGMHRDSQPFFNQGFCDERKHDSNCRSWPRAAD